MIVGREVDVGGAAAAEDVLLERRPLVGTLGGVMRGMAWAVASQRYSVVRCAARGEAVDVG